MGPVALMRVGHWGPTRGVQGRRCLGCALPRSYGVHVARGLSCVAHQHSTLLRIWGGGAAPGAVALSRGRLLRRMPDTTSPVQGVATGQTKERVVSQVLGSGGEST